MSQQLNTTNELRIHDAVAQAMLRKVTRLAQIHDELAEMNWLHFITPTELLLLEDNGFLLDFDSGLCLDTWHTVEVEAQP